MFSRFFLHTCVLSTTSFCLSSMALAQSVTLTDTQIKALGVQFSATASNTNPQQTFSARVVPSLGAQTIVALPYAGMVTRVLVNSGDTVRAGQPLLQLMSPQWLEAQRGAQEANSQVQLAQQSLKRDEALFAEGLIPEARLQATRARAREMAALRQARQSEVQGAKLRATSGGEALLLASQGGTVTQMQIVPGQRVEAASPLLRITQTQQLELDVPVAQNTAQINDKVSVPSHQAQGVVAAIVPSGDGLASPRLRVRLTQKGSLENGQQVSVQLQSKASQGLQSVPSRALLTLKGREGVLISEDGKTVRFKPIQVAQYDSQSVQLARPLPAKQRVVVAGMVALKALLTDNDTGQ